MTSSSLKVACVQLTSGSDINENIEKTAGFIREAASQSAKFVVTPENTCHMVFPFSKKLETAPVEEGHPGIGCFSDLAKELEISILIGSMTVKDEDGKLLNRSCLFNPLGELQEKYDKIHLFDAKISESESYLESEIIHPGDIAKYSSVNDDFVAGLTICYDLRFSHLYRDLAKAGANIMCIPAAFTVPTGKAHWEILLRARAIETGSFVIAPGQVGEHEGGRKTYGHSMIVSPWGKVLATKEEGEGIILADLDVAEVERARKALPSLTHDRPYSLEE